MEKIWSLGAKRSWVQIQTLRLNQLQVSGKTLYFFKVRIPTWGCCEFGPRWRVRLCVSLLSLVTMSSFSFCGFCPRKMDVLVGTEKLATDLPEQCGAANDGRWSGASALGQPPSRVRDTLIWETEKVRHRKEE